MDKNTNSEVAAENSEIASDIAKTLKAICFLNNGIPVSWLLPPGIVIAAANTIVTISAAVDDTYDGTGDPEDHVKVFQAAAQVERWAMPTWCHMFNSSLIGAARVWFDKLPPESIDGYKDMKAAFLSYFMQRKKYVKDPVEIHNIKQRDRETLEDFMERFKIETGRMKGAPKCMRIFRFMHGINNPELTKRLNEHVPKTMEEMMIATTVFIRGEAAAASKKKGHESWKPHDQSKKHADKKPNFRGHSRDGRGASQFTPSPGHQRKYKLLKQINSSRHHPW
nr:reverse transcriptase domain-containing protein [Tanacetum cinerariifolium]